MPRRKGKDPDRSPDLPHNWIQRQLDRLEKYRFYDPLDLSPWQYRRVLYLAPGEYRDLDSEWKEIHLGEMWGGPDVTGFFQKRVTIPENHSGEDIVLDIFLDGGETQLSIDGRPWQGLDWHRSIVPLGEYAQAGREIDLSMEAFIINYPYDDRRHDAREMHRFERARLLKINREVDAFLIDAHLVLDAYLSYWNNDKAQELEGFLLHHLENACRAIGPQITDPEEIILAASRGRSILQENIFKSGAFQSEGKINIHAHSHLDIIYLWPIKETFRKNARTITNQLSLMREFPEFHFSYSQVYLYEKLKELYPAVYEEVRQRVLEGRWEVIGAMYVEPDGNLLGPESWIRQIMFGKKFIKEEFGQEAETCWLVDVFGVMYTLPQILRKSGIKYFTTAKLSIWNDTNQFPYDSFRWRGPDGSEVITHFPPTHFAQELRFDNLRSQWRDFREKQIGGENLFIYGYGDGGGGPTREMVATGLRTQSFPGLPPTNLSRADDFFRRLEEKSDQLPVWDDELYLEAHRGTYTSKADLKRQNRELELLYRDAEILSSLASLYGGPRTQDSLNQGWKKILLHQFHDTLPGTHCCDAVSDIWRDLESAQDIGEKIRAGSISYIVDNIKDDDLDLIIFNTLSWKRNALVETNYLANARTIQLQDGTVSPVQNYRDRSFFLAAELPPLGWACAAIEEKTSLSNPDTAQFNNNLIESPFYSIEIDKKGCFSRIFDLVNSREVLSGPGNVFQVFEDNPGYKFSAWDIAYHIDEFQYPVEITERWKLVANGPLFAVFSSSWKVLNSTINQEMWLYANNPRIDFKTSVAWQDQQKLLKVAFPLNIRTRNATYDLPFGNIERPTHRNTSWEQAKFEVCGHKWADLSEGDYGVSLLNDSKYGYDAHENRIRLSLLRSPVRPDPQSDLGQHEFTYGLLPHAGNWRQAQVDRQAYEMNIPALADLVNSKSASGDKIPSTASLFSIDSQGLIVETIKQAEDGNGLILRIFDSHGSHKDVLVTSDREFNTMVETDLLEENPSEMMNANSATFNISHSPYEIKTYRIDFSN